MDNVFGDLSNLTVWTDVNDLLTDEIITITNVNCEFEFDCVDECFRENLMYAYIVEAELLETDFTEYVPEKSNNGGCYAFAEVKILKIKERSY